MKKSLLFALVFLPIFAKSQNWQWANQVGSSILQSYDYGSVITDGSNSYLIGKYSGTIYLQSDTLVAVGNNGLFVIKYDAIGNEVWARGFGGNNINPNNYNEVNGVFNPVENQLYLTGKFYGQMILGTDTLLSNAFSNIYLTKMDLNGNFIWGKSISTPLVNDMAYVFAQPNGNIFLAGNIGDTAFFDSYQVTPGGFFSRYDSSGNCLWAEHKFDGITNLQSKFAFIGDDIIMGGWYNSNPVMIDTATLIPFSNSFDGYLVRMDSLGGIKWIKTFGYSGYDAITAIGVDSLNDIYITGGFQDSISFNGTTLTCSGQDIFIVKYSSNGNLIWAKQTNATGNTGFAGSIDVSGNGTSYITGNFTGLVSFGPYSISTSNTSDMFLARYNNNGDCLGVRNFGYATGNSVVTDNSGNPICAGSFQNTVTCGSSTLTSNGYFDIFIAKSDVFTGSGGNERTYNNQLIIYANPNKGSFRVQLPDVITDLRGALLTVYDVQGKEVARFNLENTEENPQLEINNATSGFYTVRLVKDKQIFTGKLVVE